MSNRLSVRAAIAIGTLVVNGPVLFFMCGPVGAFGFAVERGAVSRDYNWVGLLVFAAGFVAAWAWWSFAVPRWRLWAYQRVDDIPPLKVRAVQVGLTWPDGHLFERTEMRSSDIQRRQAELEGRSHDA